MANFECGVKKYIWATANVKIHFPVDVKGNADVSCYQCDMFNRNSGKCVLTGKTSEYPKLHVGSECPLTFEEEM